jgi:hypothetical protein
MLELSSPSACCGLLCVHCLCELGNTTLWYSHWYRACVRAHSLVCVLVCHVLVCVSVCVSVCVAVCVSADWMCVQTAVGGVPRAHT